MRFDVGSEVSQLTSPSDSFTHGGAGGKVERIYREVRGFAIPAGSEEIMIQLGVKEGLKRGKVMKKNQTARL